MQVHPPHHAAIETYDVYSSPIVAEPQVVVPPQAPAVLPIDEPAPPPAKPMPKGAAFPAAPAEAGVADAAQLPPPLPGISSESDRISFDEFTPCSLN